MHIEVSEIAYRKLYYNAVIIDGVDKPHGPNFICQKCERAFRDDRKGLKTQPNKTIKTNGAQIFTCPYCGTEIILYVATTKLANGKQGIQISVNPIEPDWLEKATVEAIV